MCVRESFCESGEGVRLPRERGWAPGKSGNFRGSLGNFRGSLGLPGNLWIAIKFHSERTSGEVAGKLPGKFGELPGKSGDFPEVRGSLTPSQRLAKFVSKWVKGLPMYLVKSLSRDKGSGRCTMYLPLSPQGICRAKRADTLCIYQTPCPERRTLPDTWAIPKHTSG